MYGMLRHVSPPVQTSRDSSFFVPVCLAQMIIDEQRHFQARNRKLVLLSARGMFSGR